MESLGDLVSDVSDLFAIVQYRPCHPCPPSIASCTREPSPVCVRFIPAWTRRVWKRRSMDWYWVSVNRQKSLVELRPGNLLCNLLQNVGESMDRTWQNKLAKKRRHTFTLLNQTWSIIIPYTQFCGDSGGYWDVLSTAVLAAFGKSCGETQQCSQGRWAHDQSVSWLPMFRMLMGSSLKMDDLPQMFSHLWPCLWETWGLKPPDPGNQFGVYGIHGPGISRTLIDLPPLCLMCPEKPFVKGNRSAHSPPLFGIVFSLPGTGFQTQLLQKRTASSCWHVHRLSSYHLQILTDSTFS
jgi:hypothetical protein